MWALPYNPFIRGWFLSIVRIDIGSGNYCRADVCMDINPFGTGVGYDPTKFDFIAPKSQLYDYVIADANFNLPFRDNAFESATMIHVIEHLRCPYTTLMEIKRVLKPGGSLIIVTPNSYKNMADMYDRTHIYSFTPYSLESLCRLVFTNVSIQLIQHDLDLMANCSI